MENTDKFEYVKYAIGEFFVENYDRMIAIYEGWPEEVIDRMKLAEPHVQAKYEYNKCDFEENEDIQNDIIKLGLCQEKLWFLLVFCGEIIPHLFSTAHWKNKPSIHDSAQSALEIPCDQLKQITLSYNSQDIQFYPPPSLKKTICKHLQKAIDNNDPDFSLHYIRKTEKKSYEVPMLAAFKDIMHTVLLHFSPNTRASKLNLIGRLAYLMEYTEDDSLINGYKEVKFRAKYHPHSGLAKYKKKDGMYVRVPINIYDVLNNKIKDCVIKPNFRSTTYFFTRYDMDF